MRTGMPVLATLIVLAATAPPALSSDAVAADESAAATSEQSEKLIIELDQEPDGSTRPEYTSPVDPGDPCDDWG